ncbi:hypothetical protein G9A89_022355 [Geosiphon pyriformis]|nr:hypothetical protein G9A89_022355 [Geosiphon pyriformis]
MSFSNSSEVVGRLFEHYFLDLQVLDVNNVLLLDQFSDVKNDLLEVWFGSISVFTNSFLKEVGFVNVAGGAVAFFFEIELGIGVKVVGLLSSMMAELQTVALVLECVSSFCSVKVCLDSQAALDVCVLELKSGGSDFCNSCWMKKRHIVNLIIQKDISVSWLKVKEHFDVLDNICADALACTSAHFSLLLLINIHECFLMANGMPIFGNIRHFVWNIFRSVNHMC